MVLRFDECVECCAKSLFCSIWFSVTIKYHADVIVCNAQFIGELYITDAVRMHQTYQIASPFFRHIFSTPFNFCVEKIKLLCYLESTTNQDI